MPEANLQKAEKHTMDFLNKVLKGFLGDKNATDLKEVKKVVNKIKTVEPKIQELTDDGLRAKTEEFKEKIKAATTNFTKQIDETKEQIKNSTNVDEKENLFSKIETLKKESLIATVSSILLVASYDTVLAVIYRCFPLIPDLQILSSLQVITTISTFNIC